MTLEELPTQQREAAQLLAESELDYGEIADKCSVTRGTIYNWRRDAAFSEVVKQLIAERSESVRHIGVCVRENRLRALNKRWNALHQVIEERGSDPAWQEIAGWKTGLLVHDIKGAGENQVDVFRVDDGLLGQILAHEKQVAIELGQWEEVTRERTDEEASTVNADNAILRALHRIAKSGENGNGNGHRVSEVATN